MPKLTIEDIRNPNCKSGFSYVVNTGQPGPRGGGGTPKWRASLRAGSRPKNWQGPRRATPELAAQDYCDYVNDGNVKQTAKLKSAGHTGVDTRPRSLRVKRSPKQLAKKGTVYLITDGSGPVKIGWTSQPMWKRLRNMQTGNPRVLRLIASMPGTLADEKRLHTKYIKYNILHEWFTETPGMRKEFK